MRKCFFILLLIIGSLQIPAANGRIIKSWDFDSAADVSDWTMRKGDDKLIHEITENGQLSYLTVEGAISVGDPGIFAFFFPQNNSDQWNRIDIRIRQLDKEGKPVQWNADGTSFVIGDTRFGFMDKKRWNVTEEKNYWYIMSLQLRDYRRSEKIRIDPVGGTAKSKNQGKGLNFQIDYIRLYSNSDYAAETEASYTPQPSSIPPPYTPQAVTATQPRPAVTTGQPANFRVDPIIVKETKKSWISIFIITSVIVVMLSFFSLILFKMTKNS